MTEPSPTESTLHITPTLRLERRKLHLHYVAENLGEATLLLRIAMTDWFGVLGDPALDASRNPNAGFTSSLAYACFGGEGLAVLLQGNVDLPDGIQAFQPRVALGRRLMAKERLEVEIQARLPLREWDAYHRPQRVGTWPTAITTIELRVDYTIESQASFVREHPNFPGVFQVSGPVETARTRLACEGVTMLRRVLPWPRFA